MAGTKLIELSSLLDARLTFWLLALSLLFSLSLIILTELCVAQ